MKLLKRNNLNGLSGNMQFEEKNGLRNNLTISVVDNVRNSIDLVIYQLILNNLIIFKTNFQQIAYWRDKPENNKTIEIARSFEKEKNQILSKLKRHLIVTTKIVEKIFFFLISNYN